MAITKKYLKSKPVCKVTFELADIDANTVSVVGDFNEWKADATPLKKLKSGKFKATVDLEKDKSYEFRYIVDGSEYINDEAADGYVRNDYSGAENGVLNI